MVYFKIKPLQTTWIKHENFTQ